MQKLKSILLIDDDYATNYANKVVIERLNCCENIITKHGGLEALNFLSDKNKQKVSDVDLILLDINMPGMNGWEFLEHFQHLNQNNRLEAEVVMLTSSLNPDDREKAGEYGVERFLNKPLSVTMLRELLHRKFGLNLK